MIPKIFLRLGSGRQLGPFKLQSLNPPSTMNREGLGRHLFPSNCTPLEVARVTTGFHPSTTHNITVLYSGEKNVTAKVPSTAAA